MATVRELLAARLARIQARIDQLDTERAKAGQALADVQQALASLNPGLELTLARLQALDLVKGQE